MIEMIIMALFIIALIMNGLGIAMTVTPLQCLFGMLVARALMGIFFVPRTMTHESSSTIHNWSKNDI